MKNVKTIVGINLLVILVWSILIRTWVTGGNIHSVSILEASAYAVCLHVVACMAIAGIAFLLKKHEVAKTWLLSAGVVQLVGFSACLGNAFL